MTVKELIEELKKLEHQDWPIRYWDGEIRCWYDLKARQARNKEYMEGKEIRFEDKDFYEIIYTEDSEEYL